MATKSDQNQWSNIKEKIKSTWNKLGDSEIEALRDNLDKLPLQLQKTYWMNRDQAEKEYSEFKASLHRSSDSSSESMESDEARDHPQSEAV